MLRHYATLAVKVLLQRKFFTFISLFGIGFTLLVLMVVTAFLDHMLAPMAPETRQDRTVGVHRAVMFGDNSRWSGNPGFKILDRYARNLPGVERLSIFSQPGTVLTFLSSGKIASELKGTDAEFCAFSTSRSSRAGPTRRRRSSRRRSWP
jgi:putative ABC transport system permease protein